jgi:hypothetical protein
MSRRVSVFLVVFLAAAPWTGAQTLTPSIPATASSDQGPLLLPARPRPSPVTFGAPTPRNPFTSLGHDLRSFVTQKDTRIVLGIFAPAAGVAYTWDKKGIEESQEHLPKSAFEAGNIGGNFLVQTGAAVGTWAIGRMADSPRTAAIGSDLIRAQFVSQVVVQGVKFVTRRDRPDASNNHSFPSGHTASAFATASVLERHLGWKAGLPAYGFATYVGLARMSANKHHLSDVMMGAAVGIAAGRSVTVGVAGATFDLGVAPTTGGAAISFTKRQ